MKSKTYTQSKRPLDKNQSSKFCQSGVKQTHFQNLKEKRKWFFLSQGHFNFHIGTKNNDAVRFLDLINSAGLNQHVTRPTHNRGHSLDLVITSSNDDLVSNLQVLPSIPPDHAAITFQVDFPRPVLSKVLSDGNFKTST